MNSLQWLKSYYAVQYHWEMVIVLSGNISVQYNMLLIVIHITFQYTAINMNMYVWYII